MSHALYFHPLSLFVEISATAKIAIKSPMSPKKNISEKNNQSRAIILFPALLIMCRKNATPHPPKNNHPKILVITINMFISSYVDHNFCSVLLNILDKYFHKDANHNCHENQRNIKFFLTYSLLCRRWDSNPHYSAFEAAHSTELAYGGSDLFVYRKTDSFEFFVTRF